MDDVRHEVAPWREDDVAVEREIGTGADEDPENAAANERGGRTDRELSSRKQPGHYANERESHLKAEYE